MIADLYLHIRDLLEKEGKQKKEKQMLEENSGICWAIQEKDKELNIRAQKYEESDAQLRSKATELESLLNQEKELVESKEKEVTDLRLSYQETIQVKDEEHERLRHQNDCLQEELEELKNRLAISTSNEETMKSELNCAKQEASHFQMTELNYRNCRANKKCEELQEKCQTLEKRVRQRQNDTPENATGSRKEALRKQDKLLLAGFSTTLLEEITS
ncbi:coiled-coil domain-containing protein 89-like [Macrobrachium rosenbergii]|uniref:coiled-coil domain-containing protein 89-like n=1 Tax=Macrobrachium rosenbergii TaxID=79674 RepID=UPI0034D57B2C